MGSLQSLGIASHLLRVAPVAAPGASANEVGTPSPPAPAPDFVWLAPPGCPDNAGLTRIITARVPPREIVGAHGRADVRRSASGWTASFVIESEHGGRDAGDLSAADCALLAEIVAVKFILALAPTEALAPPSARTPPTSPPPSHDATATHPPHAATPAPRETRREELTGLGQFAVAGDAGLTPRLGSRLVLGFGVAGRRWRADALASHAIARTVEFVGGVARVWMAVAMVRGCVVAPARRVGLFWCAGVEAGIVGARGVGLRTNKRAAEPIVSLVSGAHLAWPPQARVRLVVAFEGALVLVRPGLRVDGDPEFWRAPPANVRAVVGIDVEITKPRRRGH